MPNSNVLGSSRTFLKKEAMIANVVMVRITTNSFNEPVNHIANPAPIAKNKRLRPKPLSMPTIFALVNIPL